MEFFWSWKSSGTNIVEDIVLYTTKTIANAIVFVAFCINVEYPIS